MRTIRLYVVDEAMNPVPVGVAGELYIWEALGWREGIGVAGDLTAARFVPDGLSGRMGERLYRNRRFWCGGGWMATSEYLGRTGSAGQDSGISDRVRRD